MPIPVPDIAGNPMVGGDANDPNAPGGPGKVDKNMLARLAQVMKNIGSVVSSSSPGYAGGGTPARVGAAPQDLASGPPGVMLPNAPPGGITSSSAPFRGTPLPENDFIPMPGPTPIPFEFDTKRGRSSATIYQGVKGFTDLVNTFKQRNDQKTKKRAEVLSRSLYDAMERGDEELINHILGGTEGQKNIKILEKAGIGVPPEIEKVEPPTPEQQGVHQGIRYGIAARQSKAQQAQQLAAQNAATAQAAAGAEMERDPTKAAAQVLGSTLSGDEQHQAETAAAELTISPVLQAKMNAAEQISNKDIRMQYAKLHADVESENRKLVYSLAAQKLEAAQRHDDAVLLRGLEQKRLDTTYQYNKDRLAALAKAQDAKTKSGLNTSNKMLLDNTEHYINSSRDELASLHKLVDPTPEVLALIDVKEKALQAQQAAFNDLKDRIDAQEGIGLLFGDEQEQ